MSENESDKIGVVINFIVSLSAHEFDNMSRVIVCEFLVVLNREKQTD